MVRLAALGMLASLLPSCDSETRVIHAPGKQSLPTCELILCPPEQQCRGAACASESPCDRVECPEQGTVCSRGRCVVAVWDEDGDGFPASEDCNDTDPEILPGSVAPCSTQCGDGLSTCRDGGWTACSAPTECRCVAGDERLEPCGVCGNARRECAADGMWERRASECADEHPCLPGTVAVRACGDCLVEARDCTDECVWDAWGACVSRALPGGEICNGLDDDCDEIEDEGFDVDQDGSTTCAGDCNDSQPDIHPGAIDGQDGIDNDCDGAVDEDAGTGSGTS